MGDRNVFEDTMAKNFLKLRKTINPHIQKINEFYLCQKFKANYTKAYHRYSNYL